MGLSLTNNLTNVTLQSAGTIFNGLLASPKTILLYQTMFLVMTLGISARKVSKGIETLNDIMMPMLYLILIVLVLYASQLSGFSQAITYLFSPDFSKLNLKVVIEAMGHALFSLAAGACCLMAYGSYMPTKQSVFKAVGIVIILDLLVAILTGLAIFTVVFTEGMSASSGPGLMFITLPVALSKLPMGVILLPLFFMLLVIATWTSSINLAEPMVLAISKIKGLNRAKASLITGVIAFVLSVIPALSFNVLSHIKTKSGQDLFTLYTGLPTNILLPITGFLIVILAGYVIKKEVIDSQLNLKGISSTIWSVLVKYICPMLILIVFGSLLFS